MNDDFVCISSSEATHRLVLLHGWGADAQDLIPFGKALIESLEVNFELIALRAPNPHPQGFGWQWYGLFPPDWEAVPEAISDLQERISELATPSIPLQKTFVFGFSLGGAMALAGCCELRLGGLICCSAYPHPKWEPFEQSPSILLLHGRNDEIVPVSASEEVFKCLKLHQIEAELLLFNGGHEIPPSLLGDIKNVINKWSLFN